MTLSALALLVERLISIASQILGISLSILGFTSKAAQEHTPFALETIAANGTNVLINPTYGNAALLAKLNQIVSAIDVPNATVVLPVTPPAGYGGPALSDIGNEVWNYQVASWDAVNQITGLQTARVALEDNNALARLEIGGGGVPDARTDDFLAWWNYPYSYATTRLGSYPTPSFPAPRDIDWSAWIPGDTILSLLQRTQGTWNWSHSGPYLISTPDVVWGRQFAGSNFPQWRCKISERSAALYAPKAPTRVAPVWPGLASVTLGTPVALAADTTIAGPMDGLLVTISTPPTGLGKFVVGGFTWWYRAGHVAFVDDNGDAEQWQYLTWDQAVYVPHSMTRASSALVRVLAGAVGTGTPWLVA